MHTNLTPQNTKMTTVSVRLVLQLHKVNKLHCTKVIKQCITSEIWSEITTSHA